MQAKQCRLKRAIKTQDIVAINVATTMAGTLGDAVLAGVAWIDGVACIGRSVDGESQ